MWKTCSAMERGTYTLVKAQRPKKQRTEKEWMNEWMKNEVARQSAGVFFGGKSQKKNEVYL